LGPPRTFEKVPAADLYLLKTVLYDWDDQRATAILRNCRATAGNGGRALVVETVVGEIGKPDFAALPDMGMLAVTGGIERDLPEFDARSPRLDGIAAGPSPSAVATSAWNLPRCETTFRSGCVRFVL
jgi:hypothetical protein